MAKGWKTVYTNKDTSPALTVKDDKRFNDAIRRTKKVTSVDQLKADSEKAYKNQKDKEDSLLYALDNKLLKSKTAIKQATQIRKAREAAAKKVAQKDNSNTTSDGVEVSAASDTPEEVVN